ncbi:MAG: endonuclease/exonuclease/phosphatase family protein [Deltaproteobacteria bacterium]|nr:endonuclease/exonuclease/phosphatase family protein [Deltaproteobacteria bacterium]
MRSKYAWSWLLVLALACGSAPSSGPRAPASQPAAAAHAPAPAVEAPPEAITLRLATFNIQVLGPAKASRPEVLEALAEIIRGYDVVAVQEIKDVSGEAPVSLLSAVNADPDGPEFAMALSPRTGLQPDDRRSQEQYAYFYRTERLRALGEGTLYDDSSHDHFQREPYLSRFEFIDTDVSFVLINVHTRPRSALAEIAAMEQVFTWAKALYEDEEVFIALGDFNAGCGYASEDDLDALPIHGEAYDWVVPHSADTNVAGSACPYDRIVIAAPEGNDLVQDWGVHRAFEDTAISDHFPVWVDLRWSPP